MSGWHVPSGIVAVLLVVASVFVGVSLSHGSVSGGDQVFSPPTQSASSFFASIEHHDCENLREHVRSWVSWAHASECDWTHGVHFAMSCARLRAIHRQARLRKSPMKGAPLKVPPLQLGHSEQPGSSSWFEPRRIDGWLPAGRQTQG